MGKRFLQKQIVEHKDSMRNLLFHVVCDLIQLIIIKKNQLDRLAGHCFHVFGVLGDKTA